MSAKRNKRILNEIKDLQENSQNLENNGIYFYFDESDINTIYAMLYGPEGTPYAKGFYFFKFTYPENYPMTPPLTKYCTQGYLSNVSKKTNFLVRFNPNLYTCGKVCLSMLNTWAGPGWVPTNTISNVLVAIQALGAQRQLRWPSSVLPRLVHSLVRSLRGLFHLQLKVWLFLCLVLRSVRQLGISLTQRLRATGPGSGSRSSSRSR